MESLCNFDFGEKDDELTFSQGDAIALLELVDEEWGRGQIHGRVGIFPLNLTEVVEPLPVMMTSSGHTAKLGTKTSGELFSSSSSVVCNVSAEEPPKLIKTLKPLDSEVSFSLIAWRVFLNDKALKQCLWCVQEWVEALFDFPGQTAEDLSFHKGALVRVLEHVDAEWRRGRLEGREGLYPAAFTQPCQSMKHS
uniref:SH3 domain-containing protein n=1 Tax=Kryptolebias marmoratus TaxID=37003 RepID=A0A3Q2ZMJ4_KRYMA